MNDEHEREQENMQIADAIQALQKAEERIEQTPNDSSAWAEHAGILCILGQYEKAIISVDRAMAIDSKIASFWTLRGAAFANLGRFDEQLACCDKALEIDPDCASAWAGRALILLNQGRREEAFLNARKAIELKPYLAYTGLDWAVEDGK